MHLTKKGTYHKHVEHDTLRLVYERETFRRATVITSSQPCEIDERGLEFRIRIDPHTEWSTTIDVFADLGGTTGEEEPRLGVACRRDHGRT